MNEIMKFEEQDVIIEIINDKPMFEIYSVGFALGYQDRRTSKGKVYITPRKDRIEKILESADISTLAHRGQTFISLDGLRKLISVSNTKNKGVFIDWLKNNEFVEQNEVFEYIRKEDVFMDLLKRVLKPMGYSLCLQIVNGGYRFDAYVSELDMIIEYDENGHLHYDLEKEHSRDTFIKENYSYIVRVTDFCDPMTNIGIVMNKIMEVFQYE